MGKAVKIGIIGAGGAQFSLGLVKDICLTESLPERPHPLSWTSTRTGWTSSTSWAQYAGQLGADLTFRGDNGPCGCTQGRGLRSQHRVCAGPHHRGPDAQPGRRYGYYHSGGSFGSCHQLQLMLDVARDMERICPDTG